jgi:hypothetical protein
VLGDSSTEAQEATVDRHSTSLSLAEARVADLAAHPESIASPRLRRARAVALGLAAIAALTPAGALARPPYDAATPANEHATSVHRHHSPSATPSITFTNPLGRSRGPGAGAGCSDQSPMRPPVSSLP